MENSEIRKRIIKLGKALVKELGLDPGVDTLSRWMAHYIAEQIATAKKAKGEAKIKAERQCFETILMLWQHREAMPDGRRPLEKFEPIFNALPRLDPTNPLPFFYSRPEFDEKKTKKMTKKEKITKGWLDSARQIDKTARVWLEFIFRQAALSATDEKTLSWLENADSLPDSKDVSIVVRLLRGKLTGEDEDPIEQSRQSRREELEARIEQLHAFDKFNQVIRAIFQAELEVINKSKKI